MGRRMIHLMRRPTVYEVMRQLEAEGAQILEAPNLPRGWWAATSRKLGVIYLRPNLNERQLLAALLHETQHWDAGHDGHQTSAIENRISETVASILIDKTDYATAERLYGPHPAILARELDTTRSVIEAWQRRLDRERIA